MCSKCPPWALTQAERQWCHWLITATAIEWSSFLHLTLFQFCKTSLLCLRWEYYQVQSRLWKCNRSCVLSGLGKKSSKFYKMSLLVTTIVLKKISGFVCFCGHTLHTEWRHESVAQQNTTKITLKITPLVFWWLCAVWQTWQKTTKITLQNITPPVFWWLCAVWHTWQKTTKITLQNHTSSVLMTVCCVPDLTEDN